MKEIIIDNKNSGQRIDKCLEKYLSNATKSFIYKMMRKKNITLNDKKCTGNEKLSKGDSIKIYFSDETLEKFTSDRGSSSVKLDEYYKKIYRPLDVIYENDDVILINKPCGMLSQKSENKDVSLVEYLQAFLIHENKLTVEDLKTFKPAACNRLDRNTSGIVACGKTIKGLQELSLKFKERSLGKYYICLVKGQVLERQLVKGFLSKDCDNNKVTVVDYAGDGLLPIETEYMPVCGNKQITFLKVHLITGRSHQIRAHLSSLGHPLIGDYKYGDKKINDRFKANYGIIDQMLHAYELKIDEMDIHVHTDIPNSFIKCLKGEGICQPGIQEVLEDLH